PPEKPQIIDSNGESSPSLIGPFTEGDRLSLICEVDGGKPIPSLTWWRESVLLDDTYEQITSPNGNIVVRNQLTIPSLKRHDLMAVFTCQASNNNISLPSTATVTVDLNLCVCVCV
ncbi:sidestep protein-like protein 1, partial [Sarcoptes scabiei]